MQGEEPGAKKAKLSQSHSENYKPLFKTVFPELVKELTEEGLADPEISDGIQHLQSVSKHFTTYTTSRCIEITPLHLRS